MNEVRFGTARTAWIAKLVAMLEGMQAVPAVLLSRKSRVARTWMVLAGAASAGGVRKIMDVFGKRSTYLRVGRFVSFFFLSFFPTASCCSVQGASGEHSGPSRRGRASPHSGCAAAGQ